MGKALKGTPTRGNCQTPCWLIMQWAAVRGMGAALAENVGRAVPKPALTLASPVAAEAANALRPIHKYRYPRVIRDGQ